jgi:hypothetical protein
VAAVEGDELSVVIVVSVTIALIVEASVDDEVTVSVVWMIGDVDAVTGGEVSTGSVVGGVAGSVAAVEGEVTVVIVVVSVTGVEVIAVSVEEISRLTVVEGDSVMDVSAVVSRNIGGRFLNPENLTLIGLNERFGTSLIFQRG